MGHLLLPNNALELMAHSSRFVEVRGCLACELQRTAGFGQIAGTVCLAIPGNARSR